ncbi:hypothetical protein C0995_000606, partial [Termitomyces sp. Mi166
MVGSTLTFFDTEAYKGGQQHHQSQLSNHQSLFAQLCPSFHQERPQDVYPPHSRQVTYTPDRYDADLRHQYFQASLYAGNGMTTDAPFDDIALTASKGDSFLYELQTTDDRYIGYHPHSKPTDDANTLNTNASRRASTEEIHPNNFSETNITQSVTDAVAGQSTPSIDPMNFESLSSKPSARKLSRQSRTSEKTITNLGITSKATTKYRRSKKPGTARSTKVKQVGVDGSGSEEPATRNPLSASVVGGESGEVVGEPSSRP